MKVILISNVENLGKAGDEKEVKDGYGRNFLLAKGLAVMPNDPKAKEIRQAKTESFQEQKAKKSDIIKLAKDLDGKKFTFSAKTDDKGNLYGSIGPKEIAEKLDIDADLISKHFKKTGIYEIDIKFDSENTASVKIVIEKEK